MAAGITQADFAAHMQLAPSTWSRIENGSSALAIDQLARAAALLGYTPGQLLTIADAANAAARQRNVHVEPARIDPGQAMTTGFVVIGAAALAVFVAAALARQRR